MQKRYFVGCLSLLLVSILAISGGPFGALGGVHTVSALESDILPPFFFMTEKDGALSFQVSSYGVSYTQIVLYAYHNFSFRTDYGFTDSGVSGVYRYTIPSSVGRYSLNVTIQNQTYFLVNIQVLSRGVTASEVLEQTIAFTSLSFVSFVVLRRLEILAGAVLGLVGYVLLLRTKKVTEEL